MATVKRVVSYTLTIITLFIPCSFSLVVMPHCLHGAINSCSDRHCGQVVYSGLGQM